MPSPYALIIEDDPRLAGELAAALRSAGFQADVAATGHMAQVRLTFTTPDLVLLNPHLPDFSGEIILRQLSGQRRFRHTRVALVTGDAQAARALTEKVDFTLLEPTGYTQLIDFASQLLPAEPLV